LITPDLRDPAVATGFCAELSESSMILSADSG